MPTLLQCPYSSFLSFSGVQLRSTRLVSERRICRRYAFVRADQDIAQVDEQRALERFVLACTRNTTVIWQYRAECAAILLTVAELSGMPCQVTD